jgi:hypothetical protein
MLKRLSGSWLAPRLTFDAVDTAYWSLLYDRADLATLTGVPLAMEAGIRSGAQGMVVPVVNAAVTAIVRRRHGRPRSLGSFRWQAMGVACGGGLARYEESRRAAALARRRQSVDARCQLAHLAGQNDVAMGADSIIDLLSRTDPLLASTNLRGETGGAITGRQLAAWKQSLATTTVRRAAYLGVVLTQWQSSHNGAQADLSADVIFDLREGDGTVTLTPSQANRLIAVLDELPMRGRVHVHHDRRDQVSDPSLPVRLIIGDQFVEISPDRRSDLVPYDVGPLGFVTATLWSLDSLLPSRYRADYRAIMPIATLDTLLVWWSHAQIARLGRDAHLRLIVAALIAAEVDCVATTTTMRQTRSSDGTQFFPASSSITPTMLMLPLYWGDLSRPQRQAVVVALGVIILSGVALHPDRPGIGHLLMELAWPLAALISMASLDASFDADEARLGEQMAGDEDLAVAAAFEQGRSTVIELAAGSYERTLGEFERFRSTLDADIMAEVERRLVDVAKRLRELQ